MGGSAIEDYGIGGSSSIIEGMSSEQRCQSGDSLAEWRSCEQVENGTPSTSPPFWDTDNDDDDFGPKPSELYGKFTWKIENFSQTNKRELRSNAFEVGGYKWYILIYPQGCDVSNHLSLFLCVANHDKLLPGWSHFAQFTIAVVNKDPKKSKYSDTLHRFWKKEHDWGWKKFMELSKVSDGFIVADTLVIKAQVQVIREKTNCPFRCLDRFYRRELVRVYLSNVEQIYRRFVEERRGKLSKLIEDKTRWSSFCAFWLGIDQNTRRQMSKDKTEAILKVIVKQFFIEKEVTSTLVMDSLNSGFKALEWQSRDKTGEAKLVDLEELPAPIVYIERDMFVLADDVLLLLERAALEPLPQQPSPPKDDKGTQNRTKDGCSVEELNKDSIERDERRLTELGRRTVEIFVLAHIFSRIEIAYQEAVALKRQEELIREEEAAGQIGNELKAKRSAAEKEKRMKKKQARQRKNSRKAKDKGREEKSDVLMQVKHQSESPPDEVILDYAPSRQGTVNEKIEAIEDASDVSDIGDDATVLLQPELDDRDTGSINWDTDTSEIHHAVEASSIERQNGQTGKRSPSVVDDSCSTCSTDSVRSVAMNGSYNGSSLPNNKGQTSPIRGKSQRSRDTNDLTGVKSGGNIPSSIATSDALHLYDDAGSYKDSQPEQESVNLSSKDHNHKLEQDLFEKEAVALANKLNIKDQAKVEQPSKSSTTESSSPPRPGKKIPFASQQPRKTSGKSVATSSTTKPVPSEEPSLVGPTQMEKTVPIAAKSPQVSLASISEPQKASTPAKRTAAHQVPAMSRPLSAPLTASPRSAAPIVSTVPTMPLLSRSASAAGRLGTEPSPSVTCYVPQSYRSVIMGKTSTGANTAAFPRTSSISSTQAVLCSQSPTSLSSMSMFSQNSSRNDQASLRHGLTFGSVNPETLHDKQPWRGTYSNQDASSSGVHASNFLSDIRRPDITGSSQGNQQLGVFASNAGQAQGTVSDEFPHLAIINDLLDEDQSTGRCQISHHHSLNRQYTFPRDASTADIGSNSGPCRYDQAEQYYSGGFHGVRGSSGGSLQALMDFNLAQMDYSGYANGHIDRAVQNQWPYHGADVSMLNMGGLDASGYRYQLQDYLNSMRAENGYNMYRPPSGL